MAASVLQNARLLQNISHKKKFILNEAIKRNSSIPPQAVLLERNPHEEIHHIPRIVTCTNDMIGPPHPVSNLRPVVWYRSETETPLQRKLRDFQEATQEWNQKFWVAHNTSFINERKKYIEKHLPADGEKQTLTADEMSGFYKEFLDKNWKHHVNYNFAWYKRNFNILVWSLLVNIEKIFHRS